MARVLLSPGRGPLTKALYKSFGRPGTNRAKLERINPQRLWDKVLNRRAKDTLVGRQNPVISETLRRLREAGLEDPFEITPEIEAHVSNLFARYNPRTQLEKAILLYRSIIPSYKLFVVEKVRYGGLEEIEGGLEIRSGNESLLRGFLPKEIMAASKEERIAVCLEFSHLLLVFLRTAGIIAHTNGEPGHVYVIALLDGEKYRLDVAKSFFIKTKNGANSDRESISMYYSNKGAILADQGRLEEAIICFKQALEFKPDDAVAWNNIGNALLDQGKPEEALICFKKALESKPDFAMAWLNKGNALIYLGRLKEAIECYDKALGFKPDYALAWNNKGVALKKLGKREEAIECFFQARRLREKNK